VAVAFIVLGVLAAFAHRQLLFFDEPIAAVIRGIDTDTYGTLIQALGFLGSRFLLWPLTLAAAFVLRRRCPQLAAMLIVAAVAALGLELFLKALVDRPRPVDIGFGASFPSGHVVAAVTGWGLAPATLLVLTGRRRVWAGSLVVAGAIVVVVGISRVFISAHWPSDVLGSILLGVVFLAVAESSIRRGWPWPRCDACVIHQEIHRSPSSTAGRT
jgi:membrane-associated phospholipid phosphatase